MDRALREANKYIGAWGTLFKDPYNLAVARRAWQMRCRDKNAPL
jgi:hypothetical protein